MEKLKLTNITLAIIADTEIKESLFAFNHSQKYIEFAECKFLSSKDVETEHHVKIDPLDSTEKYNQFCIKNLNFHINTDLVLLIQFDGFVVNPNSWIPEFFNFDYIGAPWTPNNLGEFYNKGEKYQVGNGGFTLRSKKLLKLCEKYPYSYMNPEDVAICRKHRGYFEENGCNFAPLDIAHQFAGDDYGYNGNFGFHGKNKLNQILSTI